MAHARGLLHCYSIPLNRGNQADGWDDDLTQTEDVAILMRPLAFNLERAT